MSRRKCAVFSARGLGDGLLALMLSHNLHLNGWDPITYHGNQLSDLQSWYPHLPILPPPSVEEVHLLLVRFEKIFLSFDGNSEVMLQIIRQGKKQCPEKIYVMNPSPSKKELSRQTKSKFLAARGLAARGIDPSSYDDFGFDASLNMVANTYHFCKEKLGLEKSTKNPGIVLPPDLELRKEMKRIILHPTSGRKGRSWPEEKFVKLALHLQSLSWDPVFVMNEQEQALWPGLMHPKIPIRLFSNFQDLARFVGESGYMIGNDSGIGHLASALGLPTVTICRHYRIARLWRPGWGRNEVVFPFRWIPNFHALRLRDLHWKRFVTVKKVIRAFQRIV